MSSGAVSGATARKQIVRADIPNSYISFDDSRFTAEILLSKPSFSMISF